MTLAGLVTVLPDSTRPHLTCLPSLLQYLTVNPSSPPRVAVLGDVDAVAAKLVTLMGTCPSQAPPLLGLPSPPPGWRFWVMSMQLQPSSSH